MLAQRLRALSSPRTIRRTLKKALYVPRWECEIHAMDLRSLKLLLGWSAPLVAATLTTGCMNYRSDYVPPQDGRARAVWQEDRVVASLPPGATSGDCSTAVNEVQGNPTIYRTYYGGSPTVVVWHPWVVVRSSNSSYRSSSPSRTAANPTAVRPSGSGGGSSDGSFSGGGGSSSSGGSGGGSGDLGKAAVVLVVVAIMTLPIINVALGLGRPEPSEQVAKEIDTVNAYNDLARLSDSPCSVAEAP